MTSDHFENKSALAHVIERKAGGIASLSESHGTEIPGHLSAAADAMRETAVLLALIWLPLAHLSSTLLMPLLLSFSIGLLIWKTGRSSWLAWARLERLHRVIEQEKHEIETNRPQEREELYALYSAKGLTGKVLEDVLDILMADNDRLLKVMLEEELSLTLEAYEHPLKQACGAFIGTLLSIGVIWFLYALFPTFGILAGAVLLMSGGALVSAVYEKNRMIRAIVWNLAIGALAFGGSLFVLRTFS